MTINEQAAWYLRALGWHVVKIEVGWEVRDPAWSDKRDVAAFQLRAYAYAYGFTTPIEGVEPVPLIPCAMWANDCQGKKDYDGRLVDIECRFWPGESSGHGSMEVTNVDGEVTIGTASYGKNPSAAASISIQFGVPDKHHGFNDYRPWREAKFEAATEPEVKAQVEAWVKDRMTELCGLLGVPVREATPEDYE